MKKPKESVTHKCIKNGIIGSGGLFLIYLFILTLANSIEHTFKQFLEFWPWMLTLIIGFGIQIGLYTHIRSYIRKASTAKTEVLASGSVSTGSMVACCLHHIADTLPIIGLSAVALFLSKYQVAFLTLGIFSNFIGIVFMLHIIQKNKLFKNRGFSRKLFSYDMKFIRNLTIALSIPIVFLAFLTTSLSDTSVSIDKVNPGTNTIQTELPSKTNNENRVSIEVKPLDFSFDKEVKFEIAINTHWGSLDFNLTEISILEDDKGNKYLPVEWKGSPPGGHHRRGILIFPKLEDKTSYIKLVIKDVYNVPERVFTWNINV